MQHVESDTEALKPWKTSLQSRESAPESSEGAVEDAIRRVSSATTWPKAGNSGDGMS